MRAWSNDPPNISDDGDTISWIPLFSDESNKECEDYYNSSSFFVAPSGGTTIGTDDLLDITLNALTEAPRGSGIK